jgi:hypothetical protein
MDNIRQRRPKRRLEELLTIAAEEEEGNHTLVILIPTRERWDDIIPRWKGMILLWPMDEIRLPRPPRLWDPISSHCMSRVSTHLQMSCGSRSDARVENQKSLMAQGYLRRVSCFWTYMLRGETF